MTKPREKTREEVTAEIEDGKKKIRQLENREKVLRQKLSQEERRTRSHPLAVSDQWPLSECQAEGPRLSRPLRLTFQY